MATKKCIYKYDNGTSFDEIMFKTTADIVVFEDGGSLQEKLDKGELGGGGGGISSGPIMQDDEPAGPHQVGTIWLDLIEGIEPPVLASILPSFNNTIWYSDPLTSFSVKEDRTLRFYMDDPSGSAMILSDIVSKGVDLRPGDEVTISATSMSSNIQVDFYGVTNETVTQDLSLSPGTLTRTAIVEDFDEFTVDIYPLDSSEAYLENLVVSAYRQGEPVTPPIMPTVPIPKQGLQLWFKARETTPTRSGLRSTNDSRITFNGGPVLKTDATNRQPYLEFNAQQSMNVSGFSHNVMTRTIFVVAKSIGAATSGNAILDFYTPDQSNGWFIFTSNDPTMAWKNNYATVQVNAASVSNPSWYFNGQLNVYRFEMNWLAPNTTPQIFVNDVVVPNIPINTTIPVPTEGLTTGALNVFKNNPGQLYEIIFYDRVLTVEEIGTVNDYLRANYGV